MRRCGFYAAWQSASVTSLPRGRLEFPGHPGHAGTLIHSAPEEPSNGGHRGAEGSFALGMPRGRSREGLDTPVEARKGRLAAILGSAAHGVISACP